MSDLYNKIESLCIEKGVSKAQMCKDVGISQGNITDLKMGRKKSFSAANTAKLAEYFNVSVAYLLGSEDRFKGYEDNVEKAYQAIKETPSLSVTAEEMSDLADVWNTLRDRSEMKLLFKSAKGATKDQIEAVARMLDSFQTGE